MKVNSIIISTICCFLFLNSSAQNNVFSWKADNMLNAYLLDQMHEQYAERRKIFGKAVLTKEGTLAYIKSVREECSRLFGDFPARSPLRPTITGSIDRDGYLIEKIIFESFPGHHVTANLYIPKGKGKFPAALFFCGHEDISKASATYQKTAILFAKNGFVVMVIDPISQSERHQLTDKNGKPLTRGGTTEHTILNAASNLVGTSTPADGLWDNVRALDYLVTRKEVDTARIGCLGNSGGGIQSIYFSAFEDRIKVFAPCSYLASREKTFELAGAADGCAQIPGEGRERLEMSDFLIASAPKPLLVLAGKYDFINYAGTRESFNDLHSVYSALGEQEKLKLFTWEDGHGISKPKREAAVAWFRKWLYNDENPVREGEIETLPEKELLCTAGGQVSIEYDGERTIMQRNIFLFDSLAAFRKAFLSRNRDEVIKEIAQHAGINAMDSLIDIEEAGFVEKNKIHFKKIILRRKNEMPVPLLVYFPPGKAKKVLVWLNDEGKNKIADSLSLKKFWIENGSAIVLCDLRGTGETADKPEANDPKYYNKEYRTSMLALHIGRPIVGQRASDVITLLDFISTRKELANVPVVLNAGTVTSLAVLHALLYRKNVGEVNLYHPLRSFRDILERTVEKNWYSYVIHGVLHYYDVPDLLGLVGKSSKVNLTN